MPPRFTIQKSLFTTLFVLSAFGAFPAAAEEEFLPGGPLAGVKLPPFPTTHGEKPGHPGCLPGKYDDDLIAPEWDLYPGSVEHWRAYMFKYMPIRSFFDRQSMLRNWTAAELPGAENVPTEFYAPPLYQVPRHRPPVMTDLSAGPYPVKRFTVGKPVVRLDLGELDVGLYAVRVIGAVETARLRPFREPLFFRAKVNDGLKGESSTHRLRLGYCDEFYSVAEVYFHAPAKRRYQMELCVDLGSKVDLLVHNVTLDDVLAGVQRRPIKKRTTLAAEAASEETGRPRSAAKPLSPQQRLQRDAAIWDALPPINRQGSGHTMLGGDEWSFRRNVTFEADKPAAEIEAAFGRWERPGKLDDPDQAGLFLVNKRLGLNYTTEDLRQHRPLPAPYPYRDDGTGLIWPGEKPDQGKIWCPIAAEVTLRVREYPLYINAKTMDYLRTGNRASARDAAVALVRWAYDFPSQDFANTFVSLTRDPGPYGRDYRCRRRETVAFFLPHYPNYVGPTLYDYDRLFEYIRGDRELADSVGRFVPSVKTPEDVVKLIDTYLVQVTAKRILRYHYHTDPMEIANLAAIVGDTSVTDPWMQWLFSRTFIYPLPVAGIQDVMITGTTSEGTEIVGSTYYAQGEGASRVAESLDLYRKAGGNPAYDLSDPSHYPKPAAHAAWRIENVVAGWDFLRIGDVTGPDKAPGMTLRDLSFAGPGWTWTRDPRFAFILKHYAPQADASSDPAIEEAAAKLPRAPWLDNRSRVLPMWAAVLETGLEHDDPRFRRAAYLRIGCGAGHQHDDALDLQVVAHGLPMTVDGGQRGGYTTPADRNTRLHNTVEVDARSHSGHSWATALADCDGARYTAATAIPPAGARLFRRQIALVDVDEGRGSKRLSVEQQRAGAKLPVEVVTPNSYVFDVFRISGGSLHTYCFHGPLHDDFQWNARNESSPAAGSPEAEYLQVFKKKPELSRVGESPELFEATWRYAIEVPGPGAGEKEMLGVNYNPDAPRKHTRLHLLEAGGTKAMRAEVVCNQWGYEFTNLMVQRRAADASLETAWAAVIEPHAGEPILASVRPLEVKNSMRDARRPVAVEVKTKSGNVDLCFADDSPTGAREIPAAGVSVCGEFAYYSTDAAGLRQATLVGGKRLDAPLVRIEPAEAERRGTVTKVDYLKRQLWIDQRWPESRRPSVLETGVPGHMTTYTALAIEPAASGSVLSLNAGADYYRSSIETISADGTVACTLKPLVEYLAGNRSGWVASDEARSQFWRAESLGNGRFRLEGSPVTEQAFGPDRVLRLWEYGVGDVARHSTSASLRRLSDNIYSLETDVDVALSLQAARIESATDGKSWKPLTGRREGAWLTIRLTADSEPTMLRLIPLED